MGGLPAGTGQSRASPVANTARAVVKVDVIDVVVPIVFPDYRISTPVGSLPYLGHAGVLFWRGRDGSSRYFEYGRYDKENLGIVRKRRISNLAIARNGRPRRGSLLTVLREISTLAGHGGRIEAAWIEVPGMFTTMLDYAMTRMADNSNPKRASYALLSNNCMTFARDAAQAGGARLPSMWDPRPASYIAEIQSQSPALRYRPPASEEEEEVSLDGIDLLD